MARPPFEEAVLTMRPPQEEEPTGGKVVPVPKSFSNPGGAKIPKPPSNTKGGILPKLIGGIGFGAAMVGIGAFVGIVVIWMGRIELMSRISPGGSPIEITSSPSEEGKSDSGTFLSPPQDNPVGSASGPPRSPPVSLELKTPEMEAPDRAQILLEMELIELDPSKAEQRLAQADAGGLSTPARTLLEAMLRMAPERPTSEHGAARPSSSSQMASSNPHGESNLLTLPNRADSATNQASPKDQTPNASGEPKGTQSPGLPAQAVPGGERSKLTPSFRERWGIRVDLLMPSGSSMPSSKGTPPSENAHSDSSAETPSQSQSPISGSAAEHPIVTENPPGNSQRAMGLVQPASEAPSGGTNPKLRAGSAGQLQEVLASNWLEGLEELQRRGIAKRIGSANVALLHRWPSQIDLVDPELIRAAQGSSLAPGRERAVSAGKVHCLVERHREDQFTLELVAEIPQTGSLPGIQKANQESSRNSQPGGLASGDGAAGQPRKTVSYIVSSQECPVGRWNLLSSLPARAKEHPDESVLYVMVRGKMQNQTGPLGQVPLSESELRERAVAQCRYLEALLQARLPTSRVQLSLAAGKIFVHGQTGSWAEQEEILSVVHRRAIHQWKVPQRSRGRNEVDGSTDSGESAVVNMLRVAQVRLRMQMVEMAFSPGASSQTGKSDRSAPPAILTLTPESQRWLQSVREGTWGLQAVVVPAISAAQWEELQTHKVARILWQQELIGLSGRKETLCVKTLEPLSSATRGPADPSRQPSPGLAGSAGLPTRPQNNGAKEAKGNNELLNSKLPLPEDRECTVQILAQRTDQGAVRLELAPVLSKRTASQSGLLSQAHSWHIDALLQPDQWLVAPMVELSESANSPQSSRRLLVVSAELISEQTDVKAQITRTPTDSQGEQKPSAASSPPANPNPSSSQPVRNVKQAIYQESQAPPSTSLPEKQRAELSTPAEPSGSHQTEPAQSNRLQVLQDVLTSLFPHSQVRLRWEANRLIVEGQAANLAEASQILAVVRAEALPEQAPQFSLVNRLRLASTEPVQYLLRVRFVRVHGLALRQAAEKVKREFPRLVPLAGPLLDLAERGGHLVLDPGSTEQLTELLAQAERLDLLQLLAQPTFGLLPGQPAEYLLPISLGGLDSKSTGSPSVQAPQTGGRYLFCRITPQWTEQGRWQLEISLELGGTMSPGKEGSRTRLLAELEPGQTSAAAIPREFYPGGARLVVLTTPEIRNSPQIKENPTSIAEGTQSPGFGDSYHPSGIQKQSIKASSGGTSLPVPKEPIPEISSGRGVPAVGHPVPVGPSVRIPSQDGYFTHQKKENLSVGPFPRGPQTPGSTPLAGTDGSASAQAISQPHGLLPKLGQLFRGKKEDKEGSAPGYTVAESPEPAPSPPLEVTVPEAPQPDSPDRRIIPRVIRPQPLR